MVALFLVAHLIADFMLQPYWLVRRKRRWDGLLIHGGIVLACMLALPLIVPQTRALWQAMLAITVVHIATDWWKIHRGDALFRHPIQPFILDQGIHVGIILIILYLALPPTMLWEPTALPSARAALYGVGYIIAALAAPIAVMVWLDPGFTQRRFALNARIRSFVVGAVAVSLVLGAGTFALPLALLGLIVAWRYPASPHPLDRPIGVLAVLCVSALVGTALLLLA